MRAIVSLLILLIVNFSFAQKLVFADPLYLDEFYNAGYKDIDKSVFDNVAVLEQKGMLNETKVYPASKTMVAEIMLELDDEMNKEYKKSYSKNIEKFQKKIGKPFKTKVYLNGTEIKIDEYLTVCFNTYPYYYDKYSADGRILKSETGRIYIPYRLVFDDFLTESKSLLKDGDNEIKFEVTKNDQPYSSAVIIHKMSLFDPESDYCEMFENKYNDDEYQASCFNSFKKKFPKDELLLLNFAKDDLVIWYNDLGTPTVKFNTAYAYYKGTDGKTYGRKLHFKQPYTGNGTFGVIQIEPERDPWPIDAKCIEAYKKKFGK